MLHPSYSELMTKINDDSKNPVVKSRYSIVMGTAKRARQMVDKGYMDLEDHSRRPLSIAVEELYAGDIRILSEEETRQYQERYAARMAEEAERLAREAEEAKAAAEEEEENGKIVDFNEDDEDDEEGIEGEEGAEGAEDEEEEIPEEA